uniref:Methylthioribose-1-phosphate isomerase n=1 Tax=Auxenochlorella protothecoides TaxID=3075 RepID=A0A1D1ZU24_AUXPR
MNDGKPRRTRCPIARLISFTPPRYSRGSLELLEQRDLPTTTRYVSVRGSEDAWRAIRDMTVRGAPAIAIAAVLSLAVELVVQGEGSQFSDAAQASQYIQDRLEYLVSSRPTAVNLAEAAARLGAAAAEAAAAPAATPSSVVETAVAGAEAMLRDDVAANRELGALGADAVACAAGVTAPLRLLTHCNTGSLATAGYGTALGVARALWGSGRLARVTCTETRPYNQGARLTAYELAADGVPATLIVDGAAAARMAAGEVDAVVVGADRVAANGDTANKIGTYALAVAAAHHGLPFFVAAPTTTLDPATRAGADIAIEQRDPQEITHFRGVRVAAEVPVWNPSFDVTPAALITGIITEAGLISPSRPGGEYDVPAFLAARRDKAGVEQAAAAENGHGRQAQSARDPEKGVVAAAEQPAKGTQARGVDSDDSRPTGAAAPQGSSPAQPLGRQGVREFVSQRPELAVHVGEPSTASEWDVREVGDGNINFVYIVTGPAGALCLKQSLPYVRMVGAGWPLTQARLAVEVEALRTQARLCPRHVPAVYTFDRALAVVGMQCVPPPHTILRGALVRGEVFPRLSEHVAHFLAATLFNTSFLALSPQAFQEQTERFANRGMCELTEQVIFSDPYHGAPHNRAASPHLATLVGELRRPRARLAATRLKQTFMHQPQALLHGDFHTGSLMVAQDSTYVIDAEFAFCGPIAFELGKWVANLLLAFFGATGHGHDTAKARRQEEWLLQTARESIDGFLAGFQTLWLQHGASEDGGVASASLFEGPDELVPVIEAFLQDVTRDAAHFAGAVMIRRIVGIARVADLETIQDPQLKERLEERALSFALPLLYGTISLKAALEGLQEELRSA